MDIMLLLILLDIIGLALAGAYAHRLGRDIKAGRYDDYFEQQKRRREGL